MGTDRLNWDSVDLVVFDVDGTLYDQRRLRLAMLGKLLAATLRARSTDTLRILKAFRHVREELGDRMDANFATAQYELTAQQCGCSADEVRALVSDWMEERPLPLLQACRYSHVDRVFEGLRRARKQVGVLSDYPAVDKVRALGLSAAPIVSATDAAILRLKPDPKGLHAILESTGVPASRALMIGDRFDRDGEVARRAGMRALIRSKHEHPDFPTFRAYDDAVFAPLLA